MLNRDQREDVKQRLTMLRFKAGRASQTSVEADAQLPVGKYFRVENGFAELTFDERVRVAAVLGASVDEVPGQADPRQTAVAS